MEYPGSKLTYPIRSAIIISFIVLFLILTPAIILYTIGYRYDWRYGLLKETGAISIDVAPDNVQVYLNEIKINQNIPVRLKNISPRKYRLSLTAPGYFTWEKDIEVKSKQTVYIKEISALKKTKPEFLVEGPAENLSLSFDNNLLAYSYPERTGTKIVIFDLVKRSPSFSTIFSNTKNLKLSWAPKSNYLLISNSESPYNFLTIIDPEKTDHFTDLISLENQPITKYDWSQASETELFYSTADEIKSIKLLTENRYSITENAYLDWWMENSRLWAITVATSSPQAKIIKDVLGFKTEFASLDNSLFTDVSQLKIRSVSQNSVLIKILNESNVLLVNSTKVYKISGDQFTISPYNNWWLIWTPWELWTYAEGSEPTLLNRSGEGLKSVIPLDKYNTLGMVWNNKITALFPYYYVTHDLVNQPTVSTVADNYNHRLYFTAKIDEKNGVWMLDY